MKKNNFKILLIEDEPDVCQSIKSFLGRRGFQVSSTDSGTQAFELVKSIKPNLILLDLTLNDLNGQEVLKKLRDFNINTKVIIITGQLLSEEEMNKIISLGVSAYLNKPLTLESLLNLIEKLLGIKPAENASRAESNKFQKLNKVETNPSGISSHKLINLLGVLRNNCEGFILNVDDGLYKNKSDKEVLKMSLKELRSVIKKVDEIVGLIKESN